MSFGPPLIVNRYTKSSGVLNDSRSRARHRQCVCPDLLLDTGLPINERQGVGQAISVLVVAPKQRDLLLDQWQSRLWQVNSDEVCIPERQDQRGTLSLGR